MSPSAPPSFFDDSSADIVLRSCSGKDFRVYKTILSRASPVFEGMFTLPVPPPSAVPPEEYSNGLHVVTLTESSEALDALLRFCYPVREPSLSSIEKTLEVFHAAKKYDIDEGIMWAREKLAGFAAKEPIRVYALACRYGWEEEARIAAKETLSMSLDTLLCSKSKELADISAFDLQRLCMYHISCRKAISHLTTPRFIIEGSWRPWEPLWSREPCSCSHSVIKTKTYVESDVLPYYAKSWWCEYMEELKKALDTVPSKTSTTQPRALAAAVVKASACSSCAADALESLMACAEQLSSKVDAEIEKVQLQFVQ
ncbi:hypothetical protein EIP91_007792 [Steccherinum ochraceum]|uniref:BTB domain-containing protein n=1 Tax=Steccherinum ochraceum TaxID=92696 RepID=A0A4R0RE17_9APHY|nr:hypothetical protein EIP91_007792 [Steccherinum ochraceum]